MILFASGRTDIPAFYSQWFSNRVKAGFVDVRNPYCAERVTRYALDPAVVDCIVFCTKNPRPMLGVLDDFRDFGTYFFVTITPYETDVEPNVPDKNEVIASFAELSRRVGPSRVSWRYDPILVTEKYSVAFHIRKFREFCGKLAGFTDRCIISFVDLYAKTRRNFPSLKEVCERDQIFIAQTFSTIADEFGISIESCAERLDLGDVGVKAGACISKEIVEKATGRNLRDCGVQSLRKHCRCIPTRDIAAYNSCPHLCAYCYANYDASAVRRNVALHNPESPLLIGAARPGDVVADARMESLKDVQLRLF